MKGVRFLRFFSSARDIESNVSTGKDRSIKVVLVFILTVLVAGMAFTWLSLSLARIAYS